jgi:hypothetical protein
MVKGFDELKLKAQKRYFTSKGLIKPTVLRDEVSIETVKAQMSPFRVESTTMVQSPYIGCIEITEYRVNPDLNQTHSIFVPGVDYHKLLYDYQNVPF